jgi:hypothetical protein
VAVYLVNEMHFFGGIRRFSSLFNEEVIVEKLHFMRILNKRIWNDAIKILIKSIYGKILKECEC